MCLRSDLFGRTDKVEAMANWSFSGKMLQENVFPRGNSLLSYLIEINKFNFLLSIVC